MLSSAVLALAVAMVGQTEKPSPLPEDITAYFQYMIGTWQAKDTASSPPVEGEYSVRWAPGRHCLWITFSAAAGRVPDGGKQMAGIIGYDATNKRVIEKNFWSGGPHYTLIYNLSTPIRDEGVTEGELTGLEKGKEFTTKIKVERKGPDEFVYHSQFVDGTRIEVVFRKSQPSTKAKTKRQ